MLYVQEDKQENWKCQKPKKYKKGQNINSRSKNYSKLYQELDGGFIGSLNITEERIYKQEDKSKENIQNEVLRLWLSYCSLPHCFYGQRTREYNTRGKWRTEHNMIIGLNTGTYKEKI